MKTVANSLTTILENPTMRVIRDRKQDIMSLATEMRQHWRLDLYTRNPGPALNELGEFVGTDLDLATFLYALADRHAVLKIPSYKGMRPRTIRENERHTSSATLCGGSAERLGPIEGLFSNKEVFSFGIRIKDHSIITKDPETDREEVGAPRNFTLVGPKGDWHDGWKTIEFVPSAKENDFLNDRSLWSGNSLVFNSFVHPNRWISFYGKHYFLAKAMIARITEECHFFDQEIKRLLDAGINYPSSGQGKKKEWPKSEEVGEKKAIMVAAFEVEVDLPEHDSLFTPLDNTQQALVSATSKRRTLIYDVKPKLTFAARSVELAFYKHGLDADFNEKMPGWIDDATWERDYVVPKKRKKWNRLVLFQPAVGEIGVSLRYRIWEKKEQVSA